MSDEEDMPVLIGNHRDAWVYGAADPNSGTTSLLEVANGLGQLVKNGWKPKVRLGEERRTAGAKRQLEL
jgi:N-acetylated-alpha-linked acidic dipeptidase